MKSSIVFTSSRSVTLELNNKDIYYSHKEYDVYLNGEKTLENIKTNVFSLFNLKPNKKYVIRIGEDEVEFKTLKESTSINVLDFGADKEGILDSTTAIQTAILTCPKDGTVVIPKGIYKVKPLFLKSDITIDLQKDATLLGETDRNKYPILPANIKTSNGKLIEIATWEGTPERTFASIITGLNVENVKIIGEGIIDGNAQNSDWWIDAKIKRIAWRPKGIFLANCENIGLQGVTVKNTPSWNLHPYLSRYIDIIDVNIQNPKKSPNTDGCDPEACQNVKIIGVKFSVGDDCIAIKSGKIDFGMKYRIPSSNITIRNCLMAYGHGSVVLGSEMSGGIKDIQVTQCYFLKTDRGLRIKTRRGRGESCIIDGITFENITMDGVLTPLVMNMYYNADPDAKIEYVWTKNALPVDERTPYLGKFVFKDMKCTGAHAAAGFFYGLPEQPIKSITIKDVYIDFAEDAQEALPAMMQFRELQLRAGLQFRFVDEVILDNVEVKGVDTSKHEPVLLEAVKTFIRK